MQYDLSKSTSTLVKTASHLFIRLANRELKALNVPHGYTPFLMHLWQEDGQTQRMLHRKIGIEQPTAARTLERMQRDGFIKCFSNEVDRRETKIYLTSYAFSLRDKVYESAKLINKVATKNLTNTEKNMLNMLLNKLINNLMCEL